MAWIFLQSPEKSPQFTNHFSSVHPEGKNQLQILKWWVAIRSAFYQYLSRSEFCQYLSRTGIICPIDKTLKETVHFFKTTMIHSSTLQISNVKLKPVSKVYHIIYNNHTGGGLRPNSDVQLNP